MSSIKPPKKLTVHEQTQQKRGKTLEAVKAPATAMAAAGGIWGVAGIIGLGIFLTYYVFMPMSGEDNPFDTTVEGTSEMSAEEKELAKNEKMYEVANTVVQYGIAVVGFIVVILGNALVFVGGMHLMNLKSYRWAMTGCIVCFIPGLSPVGILGVPLGIWGMMTLGKPEVAKSFGG